MTHPALRLMPVLDIQKMDKEDKKKAFDLLDELGIIQANDVGYEMNFNEFIYQNEAGDWVFNEEDYDIRYKHLTSVCLKYFPDEYAFKPFIFLVWW